MSQMTINGLSCEVNLPPAPEGEGNHNLPPYCRIQAYKTDDYECPANWMNGSGVAASYFIPVKPGRHLWLDFNANAHHTHHVAIVPSVQGINPVTGQKTTSLRLEQYREKCPVHDIAFGADRYCEKCAHTWPSQNYLSTVSTPQGLLWIDGWRTETGKIRGFLITAETMRGVAAQLIGNDRVFAIGLAFFLSKEPKPVAPTYQPEHTSGLFNFSAEPMIGCNDVGGSQQWYAPAGASPEAIYKVDMENTKANYHCNVTKSPNLYSGKIIKKKMRSGGIGGSSARGLNDVVRSCSLTGTPDETERLDMDMEQADDNTVLEIGAGANIIQELSYFDSSAPDFYQSEPTGMIYINYCTEKEFQKILKNPKKRENHPEGFLDGLKVGN